MTKLKLLFAAFVTVAIVAIVPVANAAPVVHFLGAGSSAMYTGFEVAAVNDLAPITSTFTGGGSIHHFTIKGSCAGGTCAQLHDLRSVSIPLEAATFWVVYTCTSATCTGSDAQDVWAYLQVDSTVGVRSFMSRPAGCASPCNQTGVQSLVDAGVKSSNAGQNLVNPALLQHGETGVAVSSCPASGAGSTTCDDLNVPNDVWLAVSGTTGVTLTAGLTDIRPEDAKYATHRLNAPLNTVTWDGLGYSTSATAPVGATIKSGVDGGKTGATPVDFGLPGGSDPITHVTVPSTITTIAIGEAPIVFIVNRTNGINNAGPGLGWGIVSANPGTSTPYYTNGLDYAPASGIPTAYPIAKLFKGKSCEGLAQIWGPDGNNFPPAGGALMNLTKAIHPGVGGASTTDYVFSSLNGAALSVGQNVTIALFSMAGNNGTFPITAVNVNGNASKFEVTNGSGVTQTTTGPVAATNDFPIHVFIREGLSGTMNTAEYTEFRSYGEVLGSDSSPAPATPSNSQEQNIIVNNGVGDNPLAAKQCLGGFFAHGSTGDKTRAIGTGQEVSAVKGQADAIGYTFFSFGNVASLALSSASNTGGSTTPYKYGYLTVDGVDPIFQNYVGTGSDPGQPSGNGSINGAPGQLPACDFFGATVNPLCAQNAIWGSEGNFPHLRDGTYRAWSLLRGMCDPNNIDASGKEHCLTTANDATHGDDFGLQGLIQHARTDIDNNTGVPDFLPFNDISFYRSHFQAGAEFGSGVGPGGSNTPETGGDVGGCILPVPPTNGTVPSGNFAGFSALNCHQ